MDDRRPARDQTEGSPAREACGGTSVARYLALSSQRAELRRERDRLLLDLEKQFGRAALARQLGIAEEDLRGLLSGARKRLAGRLDPGEAAAQITVRRARARERADRAASRGRPPPPPLGAPAHPARGAGGSDATAGLASREPAPGPWPEADALYEALGRSSPGGVR